MWVVVGMAESRRTAQKMCDALEAEGVLFKLLNVSSKTRGSIDTYEVLVLESEGDAAREILIEIGF